MSSSTMPRPQCWYSGQSSALACAAFRQHRREIESHGTGRGGQVPPRPSAQARSERFGNMLPARQKRFDWGRELDAPTAAINDMRRKRDPFAVSIMEESRCRGIHRLRILDMVVDQPNCQDWFSNDLA